ncbi:hypothetical protein [Methylobacterium sp. J-070]|uniref:hypothetical protein n=1 Tax=Methylobacterium sp. J-070 TaxID=2836650 RepID=UPI001FBB244B|nr:hypothetical protein [Methylobacterium sp. J-070]MCJ2054918.1 hypothetical protein [Methylobacterium sp. J-070]
MNAVIRAAAWRRMTFGTPRTLWGVTPILTLPLTAQCDRLLGFRSESVVFNTYYISKTFDINLKKLFFWAHAKGYAPAVIFHKTVFYAALIRYDTFNYFYDRGLMMHEGPLGHKIEEMQEIRSFEKRLYTYAYGADARTRETTLALGRYNMCANCPEPGRFCICDDDLGLANVKNIQHFANATAANLDISQYIPGFYQVQYLPIDAKKFKFSGCSWKPGMPLRVAHAPNHPHFKGSDYLISAIERLQREGHLIELVRVQGVPNTEVIELFRSCDIIAEQFVIGSHGYTGIEAMMLGKPVLCYIRNRTQVADPDRSPIINTPPNSIYDVLLDCLRGRFDLTELGRRGRIYAEHFYTIEATAIDLGRMYLETGKYPPRVTRRIKKRMAALQRIVPSLIDAPPPISFDEATALYERNDVGIDS